jgi:uncharacterized membrane protein
MNNSEAFFIAVGIHLGCFLVNLWSFGFNRMGLVREP